MYKRGNVVSWNILIGTTVATLVFRRAEFHFATKAQTIASLDHGIGLICAVLIGIAIAYVLIESIRWAIGRRSEAKEKR